MGQYKLTLLFLKLPTNISARVTLDTKAVLSTLFSTYLIPFDDGTLSFT